MHKSKPGDSIELAARTVACLMLIPYALSKPWQFESAAMWADTTVGELSGFQLMWSFFAYSKTIPIFVGVSQLLGGILFLWPRFRLIGALILLPIFLNITMFDIVYRVKGMPTTNAVFLLIVVAGVLIRHHRKLLPAVSSIQLIENQSTPQAFSIRRVIVLTLSFLGILFAYLLLPSILGPILY